jgi:hypothetical protein
MTIRDLLNQKKRKAAVIYLVSLPILALSIFFGVKYNYEWLIMVQILFGIIWIVSFCYLFWGVRCPKCGRSLGFIANYMSGPFSISKKIQYCPFCGVGMDESA